MIELTEGVDNLLLNGDCLQVLKELEDNSIDSIVTDPPYELGFMGKSWDKTGIANNKEMWKECLRVLKPGAYLLSFGGTRTYHRMACAIEDAGFEIRDMIEWVYGCLSEDTEILTPYGWEHYNKTKHLNSNIPILIYDVKNNFYKWEKPKGWSEYNINKDTCYRIKSDTTDQLVSRNHRCLVEREGKLIFVKAEELQEVEYMPILSDDFSILSEGQRELLQSGVLRESKNLAEELFSKWFGEEKSKERVENGKKPCLERRSDLLQEERQLWEIQNQICEMSRTIYKYGEEGWLCNGTPIDNGETSEKEFIKDGSDTPQRPQSREQQDRELNAIQEQQGTQNPRGYGITKAKVTKEEYTGIIFCPTVSTGCFVARRNGKIFITGNSGFPKSLAIGKAVDKLQGNEREVVGRNPNSRENCDKTNTLYESGTVGKTDILTKGTSEWEGWGTALKPSHEPIVMARKPLAEKTVAENCLKWGTGGINIDECRVETDETLQPSTSTKMKYGGNSFNESSTMNDSIWVQNKNGRFPANLIWSHHPDCKKIGYKEVSCNSHYPDMNVTGYGKNYGGKTEYIAEGERPKSEQVENWECVDGCPTKEFEKAGSCGAFAPVKSGQKGFGGVIYGKYETGGDDGKSFYKDGLGTPARFFKQCEFTEEDFEYSPFFYCAKASRSERNEGCEEMEEKQQSGSYQFRIDSSLDGKPTAPRANNHPTVKPLKLMEYLIKMVTPKNGIVLDPFMGSGTTGVACKKLNRRFMGIEMDKNYMEIATKRIENVETKEMFK
jgi:DNA modification methylase